MTDPQTTPQTPSAEPTAPEVTPHDLILAGESLLAKVATEFHKDAAVSVQFASGEWAKFKAAVEAARKAYGPARK